MRRLLRVRRTGVAVVAAGALLTACGGSTDEASPSSSSSAGSDFCTEAAAIQERVSSTLGDEVDLAKLPPALEQAAAEIRAVEPPEEIAADWATFADGVERIGAAIASVDLDDPNASTTFQREVAPLQQQLVPASTNVATYLREQCGLDVGPSESAAPSS
jgi:ABC-type glycerol-3-phosphate transport system substrate-binding protein